MTIHQKTGKKIRIARKQMGMTQTELAKKLGRTGAAIAYLEQGKRRISAEILASIADITGKPLSFFYEDEDHSDQKLKKQLADLRGHLDGIKALLDETEKEKVEKNNEIMLFRAVLDQLGDAILVWDPETGKAVDCNERACSSMGYTRQEFLKKTIMQVESGIPTLSIWHDCVRAARKNPFIMKTFPVNKQGVVMPVEVHVSHVVVNDQAYMVSMARFLEERKQQLALAEETQKSNRVHLDSFSMGVFFADINGNISEVNAVIWDILEVPPESRSETDYEFLQVAINGSGILELIKESLSTLKQMDRVFRFDTPWKKGLTISVRIIPIQHNGYLMGLQGLLEPVKKGKVVGRGKGSEGMEGTYGT